MGLRSRGTAILSHPVYNLFSALLTIAGILLLLGTAVADLKLSTAQLLKQLDMALLSLFLLETVIRLATQGKSYARGSFVLDIWALLPIPIIIALALPAKGAFDSPPGLLLLEGGRFLRLVPALKYFRQQKQAGLRPDGSSTLDGLSRRTSLVAFLFLFLGGLATSHLHSRMIQSETRVRTETVRKYAESEGIQRLPFLIPEWIIGVEKSGTEGAFEIYNVPKEKINEGDEVTYRYERDYIYMPGPNPGEVIYLNLKDLNRRQKILELMILITGFVMISALLLTNNSYLLRRVIHPVEHARRVAQLRMAGEEIDDEEVQLPENEVGLYIYSVNELYQEMRAPAKPES
tara:strand:+ start:26689 stop:27729 length:1041 start_codon:yes stop_codon:yes gene_type:complete